MQNSKSVNAVAFDDSFASQIAKLLDSNGDLSIDDLGLKGTDLGKNSVSPAGNNYNASTSPASIKAAYEASKGAMADVGAKNATAIKGAGKNATAAAGAENSTSVSAANGTAKVRVSSLSHSDPDSILIACSFNPHRRQSSAAWSDSASSTPKLKRYISLAPSPPPFVILILLKSSFLWAARSAYSSSFAAHGLSTPPDSGCFGFDIGFHDFSTWTLGSSRPYCIYILPLLDVFSRPSVH